MTFDPLDFATRWGGTGSSYSSPTSTLGSINKDSILTNTNGTQVNLPTLGSDGTSKFSLGNLFGDGSSDGSSGGSSLLSGILGAIGTFGQLKAAKNQLKLGKETLAANKGTYAQDFTAYVQDYNRRMNERAMTWANAAKTGGSPTYDYWKGQAEAKMPIAQGILDWLPGELVTPPTMLGAVPATSALPGYDSLANYSSTPAQTVPAQAATPVANQTEEDKKKLANV